MLEEYPPKRLFYRTVSRETLGSGLNGQKYLAEGLIIENIQLFPYPFDPRRNPPWI